MTWRRAGDKPLSDSMMTQFPDTYMRNPVSMSFAGHRFLIWYISLKYLPLHVRNIDVEKVNLGHYSHLGIPAWLRLLVDMVHQENTILCLQSKMFDLIIT